MCAVEYRNIEGFDDYRVGSDGTVWRNKGKGWFKLNGTITKKGYVRVSLYKERKEFCRKVHRLVLEAFVGKCPPGMQSRHFPDRTPTNNSLDNLSWATSKENNLDKIVHGTISRGGRVINSKLNASQVIEIRKLSSRGMSNSEIATRFGINTSTTSKIVRGLYWRHLLVN